MKTIQEEYMDHFHTIKMDAPEFGVGINALKMFISD